MNTFELNGYTYTANENRTYCYGWPTGLKGQRVRIKKAQFEQAEKELALYNENRRQNEANEFTNISEEDLEKLVAETEESNNTEAGKEIAKRMRTKKNTRGVAGVALTEKQIDFIHHLPDTCFWEHGLDSCIWVDVLCDEIGGQFKGKPMTVGAMISTLCEKGLGVRAKDHINGKKATSFALTKLGKAVAAELGLN